MINPEFHAERRKKLRQQLSEPILFMGNGRISRNIPMNHLPFRQDSSFLYFTGCAVPNAAVLLTEDEEILFLEPTEEGDDLWHGPSPTMQEVGLSLGFQNVVSYDNLESTCRKIQRPLHSIAVSDPTKNQHLEKLCGRPFCFGKDNGSDDLIEAVISLRRRLQPEEIQEMRETALVTHQAHLAAMRATRVGGHERDVASAFKATIDRAGLCQAYNSIVTVDGHILHNEHYLNPLEDGQLLLLDGGAESPAGYATDVTRTWPVNGCYSSQQSAAYAAVLEAQKQAISLVRTGVRYREVHNRAALVLAEFLYAERLLKIPPEEAVGIGAHALFFPHGIGHLIGLDVHDLENFGDRASYPAGRTRSPQFGTAYLRLDLDLEENMVVTIEPGFYIVPEIIHNPTLRERFANVINWKQVTQWNGFGGIRIEDDVRCTNDKPEVLTHMIPKEIAEIEEILSNG